MFQGLLYHYPNEHSEKPQLVVPESLRLTVLRELHDAPTAGHSGLERTIPKFSERFYFPGMRKYIADYIKSCEKCQKYKPSNLKPAGLLQTPIQNQRFEVLAMDLFGPLPEGPFQERWVFLVEDTATHWVELFALKEATAETCAKILIEEVFLRYGLPRRIISDNGSQFIAGVVQKALFALNISQNLIPVYHPSANPAERKNRDMKIMLAMILGPKHRNWPEALPIVRFAMNSAPNQGTGESAAFLAFARQLRSVNNENFLPQITSYLKRFTTTLAKVKEHFEQQQDARKVTAEVGRRGDVRFAVGDKVLIESHVLSNASKRFSRKLAPRRKDHMSLVT